MLSGPKVRGERDFRSQCSRRTGFQVPMSKENGISGPNVEGERDFRSQCRSSTHGDLIELGEAVGIIAGQSIGEPTPNLDFLSTTKEK